MHLLKDFLESTTDPYYHGSFDFGVRKPHRYAGDSIPRSGLNQHYWPEMVKHMEQTAPEERPQELEIRDRDEVRKY